MQGAAASLTDEETRDRLRNEQLVHLNEWIVGYERERHRLGIDDSVDIQAAVLYTWAAEVGLGVLEAVGIEPRSRRGWSDVSERFARSLMLPKSSGAASQKTRRGSLLERRQSDPVAETKSLTYALPPVSLGGFARARCPRRREVRRS